MKSKTQLMQIKDMRIYIVIYCRGYLRNNFFRHTHTTHIYQYISKSFSYNIKKLILHMIDKRQFVFVLFNMIQFFYEQVEISTNK